MKLSCVLHCSIVVCLCIESYAHVPGQQAAGEFLRELMISLLATGILKAKPLCILAHACTEAGAVGVADLGYPPGRSTGNYNKHLKNTIGLCDDDEDLSLHHIDIPLYDKSEQGIKPHKV